MMATISPPGSPVLPQQGELDSLSSLVPAAAAGDRDAWERLVARYSSMVGNVARGYRLDAGDVEDVTQTVWMRCFQHLSQLRDEWERLVARYSSMVGNVARGYRLDAGDVEDVTQTVWMRCFQHLSQLRD